MSGNVGEWCWDWQGDIGSNSDKSGPSTGNERISRGGTWADIFSDCTVSCRCYMSPVIRNYDRGFRVVRNAN